jgi:SPP1 family predicted phage head-tail adaptor
MPYLKSNIGDHKNISLDDVCNLLSITTTTDTLGQAIETTKPYMAFCSKFSITRAEFSTAGQLGFKPDLMLVIDADAYGNEKLLEYQGKTYSIYKTFQRVDGFIEVYCEVKKGADKPK